MENTINIELIKSYMTFNVLTTTKFCELCDISEDSLDKVLNNKTDFEFEVLVRIAKTINVSVSFLICPNKLTIPKVFTL